MILALNLADVGIWLTFNNLCVLLQYSIVTTAPALGYYKQENLTGLWHSNIAEGSGTWILFGIVDQGEATELSA